MVARIRPGTTPAMNICPTEAEDTRSPDGPVTIAPVVATEYMTITIDGGIRMPSAPEVVMTPAPKRFGNPALTIAGITIEPIATTVAGLDPEIAANSAHAMTPASPRPPYQCPTMLVAKL